MIEPRLSTYLDLLRLIAALVVLLSHFAYPRFTDGDYIFIRTLNLGSDAVILFFVLSGFVIAHAATQKDHNLFRFFFQRATRLYCVALPAVLLTLACDRLGTSSAPQAYDGWWYNPASTATIVLHGLTFSSEWGTSGLRLGTNGPFWSLSYEAAYYVLFGLAFYLRGYRRMLLLGLAAVAFGLKVLALMPAWLLGVAVYRALEAGEEATPGLPWALALAPPVIYAASLAGGLPADLLTLSTNALGDATINSLRFSDEFLWNGVLGILVAGHIYGMSHLLRGPMQRARLAAAVRWLAAASFSIYLVHYPVLQLLDALIPAGPSPLRHLALLCCTLALCFAFAEAFERRLQHLRRALLRLPILPATGQHEPRAS